MADCERLARTGEQPADWATDLATTICADIAGLRYRDAMDLVAARLRLVRQEGVVEGARDTAAVVDSLFKSWPASPALQRECQLDHDEERAHGWAAGESAA